MWQNGAIFQVTFLQMQNLVAEGMGVWSFYISEAELANYGQE